MSSPLQSLEPDTTSGQVIEFGVEPAPRRRPGGSRVLPALIGDHRVMPLAAGLGAVAAFASLISEWQVTTMDGAVYESGTIGDKIIPADLGDLGALGTGYLVALFPLVAAVVLTMFGPAAGRRYARLAGLSVGGTLLGLLLALAVTLGRQSRVISRVYTMELDGDQVSVTYGRGLWCAFFAVLATLAALYLAGRHTPVATIEDGPDEPSAAEPPAVWSWRRPRSVDEESVLDEPFELTVSSAPPFTAPVDDRDNTHR
ncbi:hypothetical protein ACWKSP_21425 [Micromonosporaceae bacterium Da 78-11]